MNRNLIIGATLSAMFVLLAAVSFICAASREGKSTGTPGGWLPESTTQPFCGEQR